MRNAKETLLRKEVLDARHEPGNPPCGQAAATANAVTSRASYGMHTLYWKCRTSTRIKEHKMTQLSKPGPTVASLCLTAVLLAFFCAGCPQNNLPFKALETVTAEDGSTWERVVHPGFGNDNNVSVAALSEYRESLYAATRNDVDGTEVWRTSGNTWRQVEIVPGHTHGIYGNPMINNLWSKMAVFRDKLYVGFSSGMQGAVLHSSGCEIWRYDGTAWEPVVSDLVDTDEQGAITACADNDGDITAAITDSSKNWPADRWKGGVLQITSGEGAYRRFDIVGNTADTLTVQQNGISGDYGREYTVCAGKHYKNPFPVYEYDLGRVQAGDSYQIGMGSDENGFGDYWNKAITEMLVFNDKLYVSTGLNFDHGAQVWCSEDGDTWQVTEPPNSLGNYHTGADGYADSKKPVSSSISDIAVSDVAGQPMLYAGGTGTGGPAGPGNKGSCSRMAVLTESGWRLIVDAAVDDNDTGTNENGFGDGMECSMTNGNYMPWSIQQYRDRLYVGINSLGGARVLYTPNGSPADGSWFVSVGAGTAYPVGFDGKLVDTDDPMLKGTCRNIAANLFVFDDMLYAGAIAQKSEKAQTGTPLWKTTDGITWDLVTDNSFGQNAALAFEGFTVFKGAMYVGVNMASSSQSSGAGATIFRLAR